MPDIRANVTCSLGTLVSGNIGDEYLQGTGLIRTRGNAVISGTITPALGTVVTFSYTKGGVTRNIPRKLRVLSSFADPYRRTTSVELGCKLTYLADLRAPIKWSVLNDPNNASYTEDDSKVVTLPIWASSVMLECLSRLGISASSIPVTNNFSVGEFDFSPGYVDVLSDLLVSECYCGYLDFNEVLQVIDLRNDKGTGPVYTETDIIDHGPINSGQLPGEAVTVNYTTLKLKKPDPTETPDDRERRVWERETSVAGPNTYFVASRRYTGMERVDTKITYQTIGEYDVPIRRETTERASTAKVAGSIGTAYINNKLSFNASDAIIRKEVEVNRYDAEGNRLRTEVNVYEHSLAFYGSVSLDYVFPSTTPRGAASFVSLPSGLVHREKTVTTYRRIGTAEQQTNKTYAAWLISTPGQQSIAENRENLTNASAVTDFIIAASNVNLILERSIVNINTRGTVSGRPRNTASASLAKGGKAQTNYKQVSTSQIQLALGSSTAQRRVEFSMPYAPDDFFGGPSGGPYTVYPSDAPVKATNYGRVQNRLYLGNRNGMNMQLAPERLPSAPFAPMYVQANGLTAQYRANGNQWSFDANGIVCSTDALFWAAVGGTGTFWFPVAPGITTLPSTPPVVDGTMTPSATVLPYNETVEVRAALGPAIRVTSYPYTLQPQLTVVDPIKIRSTIRVTRIKTVTVTTTPSITVAAHAPQVSVSATVVVPITPIITVSTNAPSINSAKIIAMPVSIVTVTALVPAYIARPKTLVTVPTATVTVVANAPTIITGVAVLVPAASVIVSAQVPAIATTTTDPSYSGVSLLLHMDGANNSTTVTDNSPNPSTITVYDGAKISTTESKFGGASAYFDGDGDYMTAPANANMRFGSGDFTIEGWINRKGSCPNGGIICAEYDFTSSVNFAVCLGDTGSTHYLHAGFYASSWNWIIDTVDIPLDQWVFFAFVRKGDLFSLYKGENLIGTMTRTGSLPSATLPTRIGRGWDSSRFFNGYIDEIRATKGVARYETGTGANADKIVFAGTNTLALPTAPFPNS